MKKSFILPLITFYFIVPSILLAQDENINHRKINIDNSSEYLPFYLTDIHLGMSFVDFESIKDTLFLKRIVPNPPLWVGFVETVDDEKIDKILYKFDINYESVNRIAPLFQINIVFRLIEQAKNFTNDKFGEPQLRIDTFNKQWILRTNKNYVLIVKLRDNEVKIIATIPGSEWDPNE